MIYAKLPQMTPWEPPDTSSDEPLWTPPQFSLRELFGLMSAVAVVAAALFAPGWTAVLVIDAAIAIVILTKLLPKVWNAGPWLPRLTCVEWFVIFFVLLMLHGFKLSPTRTECRQIRKVPAAAPPNSVTAQPQQAKVP